MGTLPALCWNKKDILPPHMPDHRIMPPYRLNIPPLILPSPQYVLRRCDTLRRAHADSGSPLLHHRAVPEILLHCWSGTVRMPPQTCSRKFAQICQMCRLVNAQPCTATDPDNTGIIVCRIFRINQIHTKILRGVSEPCICLCKCDVCNHGILRCSRFHMNCSFHTNSPLQCCFYRFSNPPLLSLSH